MSSDPHEPLHEPALPLLDEEEAQIHAAADRFEHAGAEELLRWALERFHPRMAISAATPNPMTNRRESRDPTIWIAR